MEDQVQKIREDVSLTFKDFLEYELFSLGKYTLSVYEIFAALIIIIFGIFISKMVRRFVYKSERFDVGKKFAFTQIFQYIIIIITFFLVMKSLGVNISPLLVGSGALLVGIGLGLQNLILDFISGVIILLDRSIKVGDVVDIEGTIGKVEEIKMRTTTILTRDSKSMIFPNSVLTKEKLINFSHNFNLVRFNVDVGVHYDTDIDLAEKLMIEAAKENKEVHQNKEPFVWLQDFGDSSLDLSLFYFSTNLFSAPRIRNEIRKTILRKFRENKINIPYPIRTLEFPQQKEGSKTENENENEKIPNE